jgi:hypothetical protein
MSGLLRVVTAIAIAAACGCGPGDDDDVVECEADLLAGDLVVTEIMANPEGDDEGNEWFEIYNATTAAVALTGLVLFESREDGTGESSHVMREQVIEPGDYLVLGGVLTEFKPAHVDYGYGDKLDSLSNTSGRIALTCGDVEVDEVIYGEATSGRALGFDGSLTPDYTSNDNMSHWCDATVEYATNNYGSPGAANEACASAERCQDGDEFRDIVAPVAGDLVITEFMADPDGEGAVSDANGEWFEVYVGRDVDLNGLEVGKDPADPDLTLTSMDCLRVTSGTYLLFARNEVTAENGGLPAVDYTFSFGLTNGGDSLFVGIGGTTLDAVTWTGSTTGASTSVDPDYADPVNNDTEANWCEGRTAYGDGDLGTPGAANEHCLMAGECDDGGVIRAIVPPLAADVTINEYLPNPTGNDGPCEWVEVHFAAAADLNGVKFGTTIPTARQTVFTAVECVSVEAGEYVVIADSLDSASNGGLPKADLLLGTVSLNNLSSASSADIYIATDSDVVLDSVTYSSIPTEGYSAALEPPVGSGATWCEATAGQAYGTNGDHGTPGSANSDNGGVNCP